MLQRLQKRSGKALALKVVGEIVPRGPTLASVDAVAHPTPLLGQEASQLPSRTQYTSFYRVIVFEELCLPNLRGLLDLARKQHPHETCHLRGLILSRIGEQPSMTVWLLVERHAWSSRRKSSDNMFKFNAGVKICKGR